MVKIHGGKVEDLSPEMQRVLAPADSWDGMVEAELHTALRRLREIRVVINDPPVYTIPFLGNPAPEVQGFIKRMDDWYCRLLEVLGDE